jgi:hypothetical protein
MFNLDLTYNQPLKNIDHTPNFRELNRLLSAAIVSTGFRNLLITNPESAIAKGYQGEKFNLSSDEYSWLVSVQATDLASLASQLLDYQNTRTTARDMAYPIRISAMPELVRVQ